MLDKLNQDIKAAMLAGEKQKADILKFLKNAVDVAAKDSGQDLSEDEVLKVFKKEAKKRTEAAKLYREGDDETRAASEESERKIIEEYLPQQMSEDEVAKLVDEAISEIGSDNFGQIIGAVMKKAEGSADGSVVSKIIKEKL